MKILHLPGTFFLLMLCITIDSVGQKGVNEYLKGKESDDSVFVITKDSVKHSGTKIKWPPRYFKTSEYIAIDGVRYSRKKMSDIIAYQDETRYSVYVPAIKDEAFRLRKGKINLYTYDYFYWTTSSRTQTAQGAVETFFLLEKEKNKFLEASFENLEMLFSDNAAVLQKYHEIFPDRIKKRKPESPKNSFKEEKALFNNMILLVEMYNKN
jgi:hypothetical protein